VSLSKVKFGKLFDLGSKSKRPASQGKEVGRYPFFTSSTVKPKFIDEFDHEGEALIIGDGGAANISFYAGRFSASDHCYVIKPISDKILPKYVYYFLLGNMHILESGFKGAGLKNISKTYIQDIDLFYPSLDKQREIIKKLDLAQSLILKRKETIKKLDEFLKAVFLDMFGDPVTNPKDWNLVKLGDITDFMTSGSRAWSEYYSDSGEIFLRIQNVKGGDLLLDDVQFVIPPNTKETKRTKVRAGDILLSITADLGRTAIVDEKTAKKGAYINQHLCLIRLNSKIDPVFVSLFLENGGNKQLTRLDQGGVKSGLNFAAVKDIRIFLVEKSLQDKIVQLRERIEFQKVKLKDSLNLINMQKESLMHKAFEGE
jgi:type I restriction enzyme, S subunit